ncbi:hypothetical protein B9Q03_10280 [Candidatus Marsarchaeota G2 archaeon OSP_D]|uniref:Uncharacterized protein n=1 Tax=Candidatus Marsarchaeota G2 archaeon OSP_D TaxID=1978157 RepID=A0A2R6AMM5_9ARCH|nr:MAG: hypothetical protein B9Q03_10280 [Candidatus Marsarchaeota G2 archaeon OSP_D]
MFLCGIDWENGERAGASREEEKISQTNQTNHQQTNQTPKANNHKHSYHNILSSLHDNHCYMNSYHDDNA